MSIKALGFESLNSQVQSVNLQDRSLQPHEIKVKIIATGVNPIDYKIVKGYFPIEKAPSTESPLVLGSDAAGIVQQVGTEVKKFKIGDEVYYMGDANFYGGSYAEYQIIDSRVVAHKPQSQSFTDAVSLPSGLLTAWESLTENMGINPKEDNSEQTILIIGGAGSVASNAIQLAQNIIGLRVIATSSREESTQFCLKMGADFIINHRNDLKKELENIGFIYGVEYIYNCADVTPEIFQQMCSILKPFGKIDGVNGFLKPINLLPLFLKRGQVTIESVFTRTQGDQQHIHGEYLELFAQWIDQNKLKTVTTVVKPFLGDNLMQALKYLESGKSIGKYVLNDVDLFFEN